MPFLKGFCLIIMDTLLKDLHTSIIQERLAVLFEIGVYLHNIPIDQFANDFACSKIGKAFENMDPIYVMWKSSSELYGLMYDENPNKKEVPSNHSPEYWVGWVLGYAQCVIKKSYTTLIKIFPCSELINNYFPYHEMDINHIIGVFKEKLKKHSPLKERRKMIGLSRKDLSLISNVPISSIKAYEEGKRDFGHASAYIVMVLARSLCCSIEDLIY